MTEAQTDQDVQAIQSGHLEYRNRNLTQVLDKAGRMLRDVNAVRRGDMDGEWCSRFISGAEHVGDEGAQILWAKILAGECEVPGSFSKFALSALANMSQVDVREFNALATCRWKEFGIMFFREGTDRIVRANLPILERAGLIRCAGVGSSWGLRPGQEVLDTLPPVTIGTTAVPVSKMPIACECTYFDRAFKMTGRTLDQGLALGFVRLTATGEELMPLCEAKPSEEYLDHCLAIWRKEGWSVEEISERRTTGTPNRANLS